MSFISPFFVKSILLDLFSSHRGSFSYRQLYFETRGKWHQIPDLVLVKVPVVKLLESNGCKIQVLKVRFSSLSQHVQKNACFVPAPPLKLISDPSNGVPLFLPLFWRNPGKRALISCAVHGNGAYKTYCCGTFTACFLSMLKS